MGRRAKAMEMHAPTWRTKIFTHGESLGSFKQTTRQWGRETDPHKQKKKRLHTDLYKLTTSPSSLHNTILLTLHHKSHNNIFLTSLLASLFP